MNERTVILEHTGFPPLTEEEMVPFINSVMEDVVGEIDTENLEDAFKLGYLLAARKVTGATL